MMKESFIEAAQLLHVTQSTLSRQIMQLAEELNVQLFHRGKHNVILTEDGILLLRALEFITLSKKKKLEFQHKKDVLTGRFAGCSFDYGAL